MPPWDANAVAITGNNNFPYSLRDVTVVTASPTKVLAFSKSKQATAIVPANSVTDLVLPGIAPTTEVSIMTAMTDRHTLQLAIISG